MPRPSPLVLLLPVLAGTPLAAQGHWRPEFAIAGGAALPEAFDGCGKRTAPGVGARAGVRPIPQLVLSATVDVMVGPGHDCLTLYPPIPPDATGHFEESAWRVSGYPAYQTGLRIAVRPFRFQNDEPEVAFTVERAWRQHLWIPVLSLSDLVGHGPVRLLLEASAA